MVRAIFLKIKKGDNRSILRTRPNASTNTAIAEVIESYSVPEFKIKSS